MKTRRRTVTDLRAIARRALIERGFEPDFPPEVRAELEAIPRSHVPDPEPAPAARDLRDLPWMSIDNDDSRDLDQLSVARPGARGSVDLLVAIADVDSLAPKGGAIDAHARRNTTSVYTAGGNFPMLPEELSTDRTSLNQDADRLAVVVEMEVREDGSVAGSTLYRGLVRNHAKLAYDAVAAWLEGEGAVPDAMAAAPGVDEQVRLQDAVASRMRRLRHDHGALDLETAEPRAVVAGDEVVDLEVQPRNRARLLIEDLMIAANGAVARFLDRKKVPSIRRVVRAPERWPRIVQVAAALGEALPEEPDAKALSRFLTARRKADPLRFPDLSLTVVKLLGSGSYQVERPGEVEVNHFGLAARDYTHSTAPNRRYPDLVTQRLLKAALEERRVPYTRDELERLAAHCTQREDDVQRVERQVRKSAAAFVLADRIGERFDGIVTGASMKGTWVRILHPPVEGKLVEGYQGLDVGDLVRVELLSTDVDLGRIDFALAGRPQ